MMTIMEVAKEYVFMHTWRRVCEGERMSIPPFVVFVLYYFII